MTRHSATGLPECQGYVLRSICASVTPCSGPLSETRRDSTGCRAPCWSTWMTRLSTAPQSWTAGRTPAGVVRQSWIPRRFWRRSSGFATGSGPTRNGTVWGRLDLPAARRQIAKMALLRLGHDDDALAARIAERHDRCRESRLAPFPGAVDALRWLRESGCRLALLTNGGGSAQRQKIARFHLGAVV